MPDLGLSWGFHTPKGPGRGHPADTLVLAEPALRGPCDQVQGEAFQAKGRTKQAQVVGQQSVRI